MRRLLAPLVGVAPTIVLVGCGAAETSGEADPAPGPSAQAERSAVEDVRDDISLSFNLDGDGFSGDRLDFAFGTDTRSRNVSYWMAYQDRDQTTFRMEGQSGAWSIDINFKITAEALGVYPFAPDDLNSNQNFDFTLRTDAEEERRLYYAREASLELTDYDGEYISGTFNGTFFRGSLTDQADRTPVTVSDGRFRVNWAEGQRSTNKDRWQ